MKQLKFTSILRNFRTINSSTYFGEISTQLITADNLSTADLRTKQQFSITLMNNNNNRKLNSQKRHLLIRESLINQLLRPFFPRCHFIRRKSTIRIFIKKSRYGTVYTEKGQEDPTIRP